MPPEDDRIKKSDMRLSGERWCQDCPDRDACVEDSCDIVRLIAKIQSKQYTNLPEGPIMSSAANNSAAKPSAPKTTEATDESKKDATVPAQKNTPDNVTVTQDSDSGKRAIIVGETDNTESAVEKLKGIFKRNSKLILVSAALVAASVALKIIKSQQIAIEDETEVVDETPAV